MKSVFGPSKDEVWKDFAEKIGGDYIDQGFWKGKKLLVKIQDWTIVMDSFTRSSGKHSTSYTRIRSPFKTMDDLVFKIYRSGVFSDLGKAFGMQDIEIGDSFFDKEFIIKGNHEEKIRDIFASDKIREIISKLNKINLEIKDGKGMFATNLVENTYELYFEQMGIIKDPDLLQDIFTVFVLVLERLLALGSAEGLGIEENLLK